MTHDFPNTPLKKRWRSICYDYVQEFIRKHDLVEYGEWYWVSDDPGTVLCIADYFINFDDLRYDIDNDILETMFFRWYDYSTMLTLYDLKQVNYRSYVKGARPYDESDFENIRILRGKVVEAQKKLEDCLNELKK